MNCQTCQQLKETAQHGISEAQESMADIKSLGDRAYNSSGFGAQQGIQETWEKVLEIIKEGN